MPTEINLVPMWLIKAFIFAIGASLGSFANVLIYRVPLGRSIVRPGSMCPACSAPIRWFDNMPILGWVFLGGRCRDCKQPISIRYPLIELAVAVLALAVLFLAVLRAGPETALPWLGLHWLFPFTMVYILVVITFIDLTHWAIPHVFTITGMVLGLLGSLVIGADTGITWLESLIGLVAGAVPLAVLIEVYFRLTKREGMGYGDVMLLAMIGAYMGYMSLPFVLLAASLQGLALSVPLLIFGKGPGKPPWEAQSTPEPTVAPLNENGEPSTQPIAETGAPSEQTAANVGQVAVPFGPFLALGALEWLFFGDTVWQWLLG